MRRRTGSDCKSQRAKFEAGGEGEIEAEPAAAVTGQAAIADCSGSGK